jgi:hypothetical protein
MSHQHFCDVAGHWWDCEGAALRLGDKEPSVCMCLKCGVPLESGDRSHDYAELLACPEHRRVDKSSTAPRQAEPGAEEFIRLCDMTHVRAKERRVRLNEKDTNWLKACGVGWEREPAFQLPLDFCNRHETVQET